MGRSAVAVLAPKDLSSVYILWSFGNALALASFLYEAIIHLLFSKTHIKINSNTFGNILDWLLFTHNYTYRVFFSR